MQSEKSDNCPPQQRNNMNASLERYVFLVLKVQNIDT